MSVSVPAVFVIFSEKSVEYLRKAIVAIVGENEVGPLRVMYRGGRSSIESDRTLVLLREEAYKVLLDKGYGEKHKDHPFHIRPYQLGTEDYPDASQRPVFMLPLPQKFALTEEEVHEQIMGKLAPLVSFGLIPNDAWQIIVPLRSREQGDLKGSSFIKWVDGLTDVLPIVRLFIKDTYWAKGKERERHGCFWSVKNNRRSPIRAVRVNTASTL